MVEDLQLTHIIDIDFLIILNLDINSLVNFCSIKKSNQKICNNIIFWKKKFIHDNLSLNLLIDEPKLWIKTYIRLNQAKNDARHILAIYDIENQGIITNYIYVKVNLLMGIHIIKLLYKNHENVIKWILELHNNNNNIITFGMNKIGTDQYNFSIATQGLFFKPAQLNKNVMCKSMEKLLIICLYYKIQILDSNNITYINHDYVNKYNITIKRQAMLDTLRYMDKNK
jgi:hypothetical protein